MNRTRMAVLLGPLLFAAIAGNAFGDLTLTADPAPFTIAPGQTEAIDIYVAPSGASSESLGLYDLTFQVVSSGGVTVTFTTPSPGDAMYDPNTTPGYIFEGISSQSSYPGTPSTSPPPPGTQIELSDFTTTFADTTFSSKMLLAVLYLMAPAGSQPPPGGDPLSVSLISESLGTFSAPTPELSNPDFSISGELTPAAVPESSTLVLTLIVAPLGVLMLRRWGFSGTTAGRDDSRSLPVAGPGVIRPPATGPAVPAR